MTEEAVVEQGAGESDAAEPLVPQSQVNKLVGGARQEARAAFLKKHGFESEADFEAAVTKAREIEQAQMSETERLSAELEALRAEKEAAINAARVAEVTNLRASIARTKGLPEGLVSRVTGDDEESITADVEELLQFAKIEAQQQDLGSGTNPPGAGSNASAEEQFMESLKTQALRSKSMF